jgi:subtilase family serine protease
MLGSSKKRLVTAVVAIGAMCAAGLAAAPGAQAASPRKALNASAPRWLAHAAKRGAAASSSAVQARVYLTPNGGTAAVTAAVAAVSDPSSANYQNFLTTAQYQARYEPTSAAVKSVSSWLSANGLKVVGVEANHRYLTVTGNVAAAQKAFNVSIAKYAHDGQNVQAPSGNLSVPTSVASLVLGVDGLDTTVTRLTPTTSPPVPQPAAFVNARPCSKYYGQVAASVQADFKTPLPKFQGKTLPYAVCGYTGPQLRAAYEGDTKLTGAGVTVGVIDAYASPSIKSDVQTYARNNGDVQWAPGQYTQTVAPTFTETGDDECGATGWYGEETLDVEAVHAMAPGAKVHYYGAENCEDTTLTDELATVVTANKVDIVTNSYGDLGEQDQTTASVMAFDQVAQQAALQGISLMFSSGDNGDEVAETGLKQADWSATDAYVTAVGGTATAIGRTANLAWQTGWGTDKYSLSANGKSWTPVGYLYGAGGGYSSLINRPAYQNGVVPANAPAGRAVPDVAMDADPTTGMLVGETQAFSNGNHYGEYRIGGTSLASPLFAGFTALALQHSKSRLGLLNYAIYAKAGSSVYNDVKGAAPDAGNVRPDFVNSVDATGGIVYSVRTFNQDSSLKVKKGWDDVTGVGVPSLSYPTSFKVKK